MHHGLAFGEVKRSMLFDMDSDPTGLLVFCLNVGIPAKRGSRSKSDALGRLSGSRSSILCTRSITSLFASGCSAASPVGANFESGLFCRNNG